MNNAAYPHGRWSTQVRHLPHPNTTADSPTPSFAPPTVYTFFIAPFAEAHQVQLVGDFTNWEKSPINMQRGRDGSWFTSIPLIPGAYAYAYVVDGSWLLDPASPIAGNIDAAFNNICYV